MPAQSNNISNILHPGYRNIKQSFATSRGIFDPVERFTLYRAIVVKIIITIDNDHTGSLFPPGTIECQILGEIVTSSTDQHTASTKVLPLNDLHSITIPEVGEEVWIIKESNKKDAIPYWLSRVNDSNFISRVLAKESYKDQSPQARYGYNFVVEEIDEKVTHEGRSYSVPFNPGDVIQQGRSDSYIRHSFNVDDKDEGVLELGIKERRRYGTPIGPSIGQTHTKTLHRVINGNGAIFNLTDTGSFDTVEQQVLGNKLNEALSGMANLLISMTKSIEILSGETDELKGNIEKVNNKQTSLNISKDEKGNITDIQLEQPSEVSIAPGSFTDKIRAAAKTTQSTVSEIKDVTTIIDELIVLRDSFKNHLSKGQFIN